MLKRFRKIVQMYYQFIFCTVLIGASVVRGSKDLQDERRHICRRHFGRVVSSVLRQKDVM